MCRPFSHCPNGAATIAVLCAAITAPAALAAPSREQPAPTADSTARTNPFFSRSTLPFQAPPFDTIRDGDFKPAFEKGMKEQRAEVAKIADNPAPPTFDNTLVALERSGQLLTRVSLVFNALTSANTDPTLQKLQEEMAPRLAAHQDAILLDANLLKRIERIYGARGTLGLDPESVRLVEVTYERFVHAGAKLARADKARLKKLNEREATLMAQFANKLLAATKGGALVVSDKGELVGFSQEEIDAAAQAAAARGLKGKWVLPLQNTTQQPALASLTDRGTREKLFEASWMRTEHGDANDTRATIAELASLRAEKAKLLGYPNYASWSLEDQMAKTPATVDAFLAKLVLPATANARREAADIQALIDEQHGDFKLRPWDWEFYAEQVRKAKYDLDEAEIKPYFELDRVLTDGVFYAAHELYGLTFKERHDLPVWNPDVRTFEVFDHDGSPLALFYCDYFKRDNKQGGAWMDNLVNQSKLLGTKPVVYNVCNFTKPAPGQPALLSNDDVSAMFHEFGHALHGMFADQRYPSLSGTNVARDFVELPSQINEHWALYPKVLAHYAVNYATGKPMPEELAEKIRKAATFNQGYEFTEALAAAALDMQWHTLPADAPEQKVDAFETTALRRAGVDLPQAPPRYRSSYFLHIWANGYAAGYYAYAWAEMLDDDAFAWFEENGGLTRANGDRFRAMVLSRGNSEDLAKMYRDFRGRDPQIEPLLEYRGLTAR
jgi:peptidyl-dipeptidase Dcp